MDKRQKELYIRRVIRTLLKIVKKIKIKSKKLDVKQLISQDLEYAYPCTIFLHLSPVLLPGKSHGWRSLVGCSP